MDARLSPESSGKPRLLLIALIALGVLALCIGGAIVASIALHMPVRSEITQVDSESPQAQPPAEETQTGIEAEAAAVAAAILAEGDLWDGSVAGVKVVTLLRRPVIVVSTTIGPEEASLSDKLAADLASFVSALTLPDGSRYTFYIQMRSSEGDVIGGIGSPDSRWTLVAPDAPAAVDGLYAWLQQTYGTDSPDPEPWFTRIAGVDSTASAADGFLVIRTDLDPSVPGDLIVAQTIIDAVNSSGVTFAPGIRVLFRDGAFEWSSMLTGTDPYGP